MHKRAHGQITVIDGKQGIEMVKFKDPFEKLERENERKRAMRRPLVAGNWKMNKVLTAVLEFALDLKKRIADVSDVEVLICPPFPFLGPLSRSLEDSTVKVGAQDVYWEENGAFTGSVSAQMLDSVGCSYVIVGHSERRHIFGDSSEEVNKKTGAVLASYMIPIVCVGEKLEEREEMRTEEVLREQITHSLAGFNSQEALKCVIAYEPVWAIGTGKTATAHQANDAHGFIRELLRELFNGEVCDRMRILYGGSVKPENVAELMREPDIDGVLVGGASLTVDSFEKLIRYKEAVAPETQ